MNKKVNIPFTVEDIKEYEKVKLKFDRFNKKIDKRVDRIIKVIHEIFDTKMTYGWWFPNAEEGERGFIDLSSKAIDFNLNDPKILETDEWDYAESFPKEFLFMTDNQIKDVILKQIAKSEKEKIEEKKIDE